MIFVTVGTHEQQFNRLIKIIDDLVADGSINEKVIIQKGYSDYIPTNCEYYDFLDYSKMQQYMEEARIVITHGGPSSFMDVLAKNKLPIVVPREKKRNEHVNDHQVIFTREVNSMMNNIILAETEEDIKNAIIRYDEYLQSKDLKLVSNTSNFIEEFEKELKKLF